LDRRGEERKVERTGLDWIKSFVMRSVEERTNDFFFGVGNWEGCV
jgi:hypothetical protein